ncbi:murein hydrolase activator EnvC-like [Phoenix dactylifera]|uniref:Murein hydrolase activator EnvC-like n=1 Tax=Phoenix dactylifera TaxID=42345 RepID=A0A8B8ZLF7_PHODC|nr:murein hydrolase activator EnvC-like [Phoenix dactylifera]
MWGFDPRWGQSRLKTANKLPRLSESEQRTLDALYGLEEDILLNDLVSEVALVNVGLSSAPPQDILKMVISSAALYARFRKRAADAGGHLHEVDMLISVAADYRDKARRYLRAQEEAEKRLGEAEASQREALTRVEAAEVELRSAVAELEEESAAHALAKSEVRASEARLAEARSTIAGHEHEARVAQLKTEQLEAREKRALEQAQNAVQLFRESEEFRELMEEEAVDGLIRSFEDFRR